MAEMTAATALRQLQQAQAGLRKSRHAIRFAKGDPDASASVLRAGWESLAQCHRLLAAIPASAATEPVMTKQLAVQRYATALLVRLRRIARNEGPAIDDDDEIYDEDEE
jgi:hypothetical protein